MAEKKILVNLNFNKNEAIEIKMQVLATHPSGWEEGMYYYNSTDNKPYILTAEPNTWSDMTGTGGANLSLGTRTAITMDVNSDSGSDATLLAANTNEAGLMTDVQFDKLTDIEALADVTDETNVNAAGATMNTDTDVSANGYVLDEDNMVSDDDTKVPTQQSVKAYVDNKIVGGHTNKGGYNANTNTPDLDTSPSGILDGDTYVITAAGTFFTEDIQIGDMIIAEQDDPTLLTHWTRVNKNIPDIVSASESAQGIIEIATQAEVTAGTDDTRALTPLKLKNSGCTKKYAEDVGNGSLTSITVNHALGSSDVTVIVYDNSTKDVVDCEQEITDTNNVELKFNIAPTTDQYRCVVIG